MGNNVVCKTIGIGNIRIRMYDGQARTLTNVRHFSDLKKDILSLGFWKLKGASFQVQMELSKLQVTKDSMTILKEERTSNLYKITRNIIVGDTSAAIEEETTTLWHMRLGHMSERDLQVLQN